MHLDSRFFQIYSTRNLYLCVFTAILSSWNAEVSAVNNTVSVHTRNIYNYISLERYGIGIQGCSLAFKVKACNDAHVGLFSNDGSLYEIVISGWSNTQSVIRNKKQGDHKATYKGKLLDCNAFKPFWISWSSGDIKVGRGNKIDHYVFMKWKDENPHKVDYAGISTGWGSSGDWIIKQPVEDNFVDITCQSHDFKYQSCEKISGHITEVLMLKQISTSPCTKCKSYGIKNHNQMYVKDGCRGNFRLYYASADVAESREDNDECENEDEDENLSKTIGLAILGLVSFVVIYAFCTKGKQLKEHLKDRWSSLRRGCTEENCMKRISCICLSPCLFVNWLRLMWKEQIGRNGQETNHFEDGTTQTEIRQMQSLNQNDVNVTFNNGSIEGETHANINIEGVNPSIFTVHLPNEATEPVDNSIPPPSYDEATKDDPPSYLDAHNYQMQKSSEC